MKFILNSFIIIISISSFNTTFAQNYFVGQNSESVVDPQRSRNIPTEIFYPATQSGTNTPVANGNFPLIVFGHGFSMNFGAYENFVNEFVPQGYIIAFPKTEVGPVPFPDHGAFGEDLSFVADYYQGQINNPNAQFFQKINGKTAVMGHSMGGGCSYLAAEQNPNINAIATFAAAETNVSAIGAAQNVSIPALVFAGSEDNVAPPAGNQIDMYNALLADCKYLITLDGGSHCGFGIPNTACDFGETSVCLFCNFISRAQQHSRTFAVLSPWLDFHLKGECQEWNTFENALQNTTDLTVQSSCNYSLPEATFQALGDSTFCEGDSIVLNTSSNLKKKWSNADTSLAITVRNSSLAFLTVEDDLGCKDTSRTISITKNEPLAVRFEYPDTTFCNADSVALQLRNQQNYNQITWDGNSQDSIWARNTAAYFVEVQDSNNCYNRDSIQIVISNERTYPLPEIAVKPGIEVCTGDSVYLSLADSIYGGVNWNNGVIALERVVDSSGQFFYTSTDSFNCTYQSEIVSVNFNNLPLATIDSIEDTLRLLNFNQFIDTDWYFNDTILLAQANNNGQIVVDSTGRYSAFVTDSNGCAAFSNSIYFEKVSAPVDTTSDTVSVATFDFSIEDGIKIYPNPFSNTFYIDISDSGYRVKLLDVNGKGISDKLLDTGTNTLSTEGLSSGFYFLHIYSAKESYYYKVLKR